MVEYQIIMGQGQGEGVTVAIDMVMVEVNALLSQGWELYGDLVVIVHNQGYSPAYYEVYREMIRGKKE